jgi:hypothetical protein
MSMIVDVKTFAHSRLHSLLVGVFESLLPRLLSISNNSPTTTSNAEIDGIEAIAMLTVLVEFTSFYLDTTRGSLSIHSTSRPSSPSISSRAISTIEEDVDSPPIVYFYSTMIFAELKEALEQRIYAFTTEQINWILVQKGDPKAPGVFPPFYRFPTLVLHVVEMLHEQVGMHTSLILSAVPSST